MGIHLELVNHDTLFQESSHKAIVLNHFDLTKQTGLDKLNDYVYTTYEDSYMEVLPHCDCKYLTGGQYVGSKCPKCLTFCQKMTERPLESILWIAAPDGIEALINPHVWIILENRLTVSRTSILEWLTNPHLIVQNTGALGILHQLEAHGVQRGINYFYHHFDEIMDLLINQKVIKKHTPIQRNEIMEFIRENRESIFSKHIPVPSRLAIITEKSNRGRVVDESMVPAVEAVRTISSIENSPVEVSIKKKEAKTTKAIKQLADFYMQFYRSILSSKKGWFRKHIYGSRIHFSFRAVISSISEPHEYDEIYLPWSLAIMFLKIHLISKLMKRPGLHFTPNEAIGYLNRFTMAYDPLLDEILQELIDESPRKGIVVGLQRNPSLTRGSFQTLRVTKIKKNPNINTISLSVLVLESYNADFDGDQLNGMLIHDLESIERFERHQPHLYALDVEEPYSLSRFIQLQPQIIGNIANWVQDGENV